eukprot:2258333-Pyramimonas_sp.AAC.1
MPPGPPVSMGASMRRDQTSRACPSRTCLSAADITDCWVTEKPVLKTTSLSLDVSCTTHPVSAPNLPGSVLFS